MGFSSPRCFDELEDCTCYVFKLFFSSKLLLKVHEESMGSRI